jgi:hypothetical protein
MKDLTKQLVHMHKPYLCKWVLGERIIYNMDTGERVAIVLDSVEFRKMMAQHADVVAAIIADVEKKRGAK